MIPVTIPKNIEGYFVLLIFVFNDLREFDG